MCGGFADRTRRWSIGRLTKIADQCVTAAAAWLAARMPSEGPTGGDRRRSGGEEAPCRFPRVCRCGVGRRAAIYFESLPLPTGALRSDFFFRPSEAISSESAPNWAMT